MAWLKMARNGRKSQEQSGDHGGHRRRFIGLIRARPGEVGREIWPA